jgi:hypothetical protein
LRNERRRLDRCELVAHGLQDFNRYSAPSIVDDEDHGVRLPSLADSTKLAWPPPRRSLAAIMADSMVTPSHPGADWTTSVAADNVLRADNERRWRADEEQRQLASRRAYEQSLLRQR